MSRALAHLVTVAALLTLAAILVISCGQPSRDLLVHPFDAGQGDAADATDGAPVTAADGGPVDPFLGGPCVDDAQCDDTIACTFDTCDQSLHRCRTVPDNTQCDDHVYCNGQESCQVAHGCVAGGVVGCSDGDVCTIDRCIEATQACEHTARDADGDGDPDINCPPGKDCNDTDPTVSSKDAEICGNLKDDNCNGLTDETPCTTPQADGCATAFAVTSPGTYALSTVGASVNFTATCGVTMPRAAHDVVLAVTLPAGDPVDLDIWATAPNGGEVSVAVFGGCAAPESQLACGAGGSTTTRSRARSLSPGTYFVVVTTQAESPLEVAVDFLPASARPTNEDCTAPANGPTDQPFVVELIDAAKDLPSACPAVTGELTYAFSLPSAADVRIFPEITRGSSTPILGLRDAGCTTAGDELRCISGGSLPLFARALASGTYVLTVAATSPADVQLTIQISPPTVAPSDELCATAPAIAFNAPPVDIALADHDGAILDGCFDGHPHAARAVHLDTSSDVMIIGRFPQGESGAVTLDGAVCTAVDTLACGAGPTPVRITRRAVTPGDYRAVIADQAGGNDTLSVLVRPTAAPVVVGSGADTCAAAIDIPESGGFFSGDTTGRTADFDDGCDTPGQANGGAPDQVLRLVLTAPRRVVLNMDGSAYQTILDVRQGTTCPGLEVSGACFLGNPPGASFLDIPLPAGSYWIVIDGFNGMTGTWNLDVRVL